MGIDKPSSLSIAEPGPLFDKTAKKSDGLHEEQSDVAEKQDPVRGTKKWEGNGGGFEDFYRVSTVFLYFLF